MKKDEEVQKKKQKADLNLIVFKLLERGIRPSKMCEVLNLKKTALQYYLSTLKRNGFIKKVGYGVWEIIKNYDPKEVQKSTQVTPAVIGEDLNLLKENYVRAHAFMFTLKIPEIKDWDRREEILDNHAIKYISLGNLGGGQKLVFKGRNVHLKNNSIIVYERSSYFSQFAKKAQQHSVYDYLKLIRSLEKFLGIDFSFKGHYKFKVSRQHYSLVKNALAKQYDEEGKKLSVYNAQGLWFIIDNSFNLHEAEAIHPKTALEDIEKVQDFFNELKINPMTTTEIKQNFTEINELLKQSSRSQVDTAMVLQQLDGNVKQIVKILGERK